MYEFICSLCGRRYYSASPIGPKDRCDACGGKVVRTGVEGQLEESSRSLDTPGKPRHAARTTRRGSPNAPSPGGSPDRG